MKISICFLLTFTMILPAFGQTDREPKTPFTKMYLPVWLEARDHCLDVARAMPEELYTYKPTEVSKTFGEQMVHIAHTVELLTQRYVQGMEVTPNTPDASKMTKAEYGEPGLCFLLRAGPYGQPSRQGEPLCTVEWHSTPGVYLVRAPFNGFAQVSSPSAP